MPEQPLGPHHHDGGAPGTHVGEAGVHVGHHHAPESPEADVHGMLVVGEDSVYVSHLPMFEHPHHRYQAIAAVTLADPADPRRSLQDAYVSDRSRTAERFYTLQPERFVLTELVFAGSPRREFSGTLFGAHFERPGRRRLFETLVRVENVIHFRELEDRAARLERLEYLLFGSGRERFLAHLISAPPDFDQVLPVRLAGQAPGDEESLRGARVVVRGRANTFRERLKASETVTADLQLAGEPDGQTFEVQLEAGRELYFEEGELRVPAVFEQTAEERAAGF